MNKIPQHSVFFYFTQYFYSMIRYRKIKLLPLYKRTENKMYKGKLWKNTYICENKERKLSTVSLIVIW